MQYLQLDGSSGRERSSILQNYKSSDFKNIIWFLNLSSFYLVIVLKSSHWTSPTREKAQYVTLGSSASDLQQLGNHRSLLVRTCLSLAILESGGSSSVIVSIWRSSAVGYPQLQYCSLQPEAGKVINFMKK